MPTMRCTVRRWVARTVGSTSPPTSMGRSTSAVPRTRLLMAATTSWTCKRRSRENRIQVTGSRGRRGTHGARATRGPRATPGRRATPGPRDTPGPRATRGAGRCGERIRIFRRRLHRLCPGSTISNDSSRVAIAKKASR